MTDATRDALAELVGKWEDKSDFWERTLPPDATDTELLPVVLLRNCADDVRNVLIEDECRKSWLNRLMTTLVADRRRAWMRRVATVRKCWRK